MTEHKPTTKSIKRGVIPRRVSTVFTPGTYLRCAACGRLLKIEWATRSIVCSCGARIMPPKAEAKG